jgi:hypothetical protein
MKNFIITLSFLLSFSAQAEYKIGDTATYATISNGQSFDLKNDVLAVDAENDLMTIKQTVIMNGSVLQQNTTDEKISDTEQNEFIFDVCLQAPISLNPRYETITVLAGTFNTCHISAKDETGAEFNGYYSKVLFGFVKITKTGTTDNTDLSLELKSFKKL